MAPQTGKRKRVNKRIIQKFGKGEGRPRMVLLPVQEGLRRRRAGPRKHSSRKGLVR